MDAQTQDLIDTLERDGLAMLRNVLDPSLVRRANEEVEACLKDDLAERRQAGVGLGHFRGSAGRSQLDQSKHLLIDFFAKSPVLDQLANQLLNEPRVAAVAEKVVGEHRKLRGYNIRHLTGTSKNSAMEWHRDNRGEFNFAILLNETAPDSDGATCYIPGSHLYPYCPFQALHVQTPYALYSPRMGYFTRRLMRKVTRQVRSAHGTPGDAYLFVGDVWHGRQPNLNGRTGTVLFFAVFPGEMPFPAHSSVDIPQPEVLEALPPELRKIVQHDRVPENRDRSAYLYVMEARRQAVGLVSLWRVAMWERKYSVPDLVARITGSLVAGLLAFTPSWAHQWLKRLKKKVSSG